MAMVALHSFPLWTNWENLQLPAFISPPFSHLLLFPLQETFSQLQKGEEMSHSESPSPPPSSSDLPPETEIPGPSTPRNDRHATVMEKFKEMIFKFAIASSPTKSLPPLQRSSIERRLDEYFPRFRTPDHPPYSAMIQAAIQKLDEEGASSEEAISQFIRKEYPDLPWAHDTLLKHHLENLCEVGIIVKVSGDLYMLGSLVNRRDSAPSPCSSFDSYFSFSLSPERSPSSRSWSSSSFCSSPILKRKRSRYRKRRKKLGRKRGSKNKRSNKGEVSRMRGIQVPKRRPGRPPKKKVLEDETETSSEDLSLEEKSDETEEQTTSMDEFSEGAECNDQVRRAKRQKIRKHCPKQEGGLVIDLRVEKCCQVIDRIQTEEVAGMQQEGEAEQETFSKEAKRVADNEEGNVLEKTNSQAVKEQRQVEGHDMVSEQDLNNKKKRKRPLKDKGTKERKAHPKPTCIPGRKRGRPRKESLLVEKTQLHEQQMETAIQGHLSEQKIEVPKEHYKLNKELDEVVEDYDQLQGDMNQTLELSQAENTHTVSKIEKSGSVGEANKVIKPCNFFMDVDQQKNKGIEESIQQKERENFEVIEEPSQLEERNIVPEQDKINGQKRRGRPPKGCVKRRKVYPKAEPIPGKRRGRPCKKDLCGGKTQPRTGPRRARGRPRKKDLCVEKTRLNEVEMETLSNQDHIQEEETKVLEQKYETNKEVTEVVEEHNQTEGNVHDTLERSLAGETKMVKKKGKSGQVSKEKKLTRQNDEATKGFDQQKLYEEGACEETISQFIRREYPSFLWSGVKTKFRKPDIVPKQDHRIEQKRNGQLLYRGARGKKVYLKHLHTPGRGMGGPRKKAFMLEKTQVHTEEIERTEIQDPTAEENTVLSEENCEINKECTEVEHLGELKGNANETLECIPAEKTQMAKEVMKPSDENLQVQWHNFLMEGEQQKDLVVKGFNEQNVHENSFDEEQNQSEKGKNEMAFEKNQLKGQKNEQQNQQLKRHAESIAEEGASGEGTISQFIRREYPSILWSGGKTQFRKPDTVPKLDRRIEQKRNGQLLNRGGARGKKVYLKHLCIPGRGMGGPRKKDFIKVEKTQVHTEEIERTDIQDSTIEENTELSEENCEINKEGTKVEDSGELKGNVSDTMECIQELKRHEESIAEKEVGLHEIHGYETQIEENIQPEGQYKSITKSLLGADVAERCMDWKTIGLPMESSGSVLEDGKENSNKSMEPQRTIPGKEKVTEIGGRGMEVPELLTADNIELKSVEGTSQLQHAEEKPPDGKVHSCSPKSFSSCRLP
ncbi:hypothetical protein M9H77_08102 [Catharanthus roseus]|uniref:Uncharacterized protein n=1 Tax=Catharanthus roseus TaxID=4058 RepID=A0ACC0BWT1_CATRO|nr:hypothetical protein M9H77_08102 [Catharanthus roseus]